MRYVDDIFAISKGTKDDALEIFDQVNHTYTHSKKRIFAKLAK